MKKNSRRVGGELTVASWCGFALTVLWVGYIIGEVVVNRRAYELLKLNELGDFLAGAGGPIVLLWIVIGYFQQSAALRLQQEELRSQVEETRRLVEQSKRQVDLIADQNNYARALEIKNAQPNFSMQQMSSSSKGSQCNFRNHGPTVTNVEISCDAMIDGPLRKPLWERLSEGAAFFDAQNVLGSRLSISYTDARGVSQYRNYIVSRDYTLVFDVEYPGSIDPPFA